MDEARRDWSFNLLGCYWEIWKYFPLHALIIPCPLVQIKKTERTIPKPPKIPIEYIRINTIFNDIIHFLQCFHYGVNAKRWLYAWMKVCAKLIQCDLQTLLDLMNSVTYCVSQPQLDTTTQLFDPLHSCPT